MSIRRLIRAGALAGAAGLLLTAPVPARAMTTDGTLITNSATVTQSLVDGIGYTVSYSVTAIAFVANPCALIQKTVSPAAQASGAMLTFTVWIVNCSCTGSAFNITMTDQLPANVGMGMQGASWNGGCGGSWYPASSPDNATWGVGLGVAGQTAPWYLRFTLNLLGPCASAMESYTVTVL